MIPPNTEAGERSDVIAEVTVDRPCADEDVGGNWNTCKKKTIIDLQFASSSKITIHYFGVSKSIHTSYTMLSIFKGVQRSNN